MFLFVVIHILPKHKITTLEQLRVSLK